MILGHHLILSAYGFWLPNDPRGSWSDFVRNYELLPFGKATKVDTRLSVAALPHDPTQRIAAKTRLRFEPVLFNGQQAKTIGEAFAFRAKQSSIDVFACAILPDHAHLIVARHRLPAEQLINQFKGAATWRLMRDGLHPFVNDRNQKGKLPSVWASSGRKVFIDNEPHMRAAIRYVENNPLRAGLPRQRWNVVKPYLPNG